LRYRTFAGGVKTKRSDADYSSSPTRAVTVLAIFKEGVNASSIAQIRLFILIKSERSSVPGFEAVEDVVEAL